MYIVHTMCLHWDMSICTIWGSVSGCGYTSWIDCAHLLWLKLWWWGVLKRTEVWRQHSCRYNVSVAWVHTYIVRETKVQMTTEFHGSTCILKPWNVTAIKRMHIHMYSVYQALFSPPSSAWVPGYLAKYHTIFKQQCTCTCTTTRGY